MKCVSLSLLAAVLVAASANPVYNETNVRDDCTITDFSQVSSVVSNCFYIHVLNLTVPAGETLLFDLQPFTYLKLQGTITFSSGIYWDGPLIEVTGTAIHVYGEPGHVLDGQGDKYWDGNGDSGVKKPKFLKIKTTDESGLASNLEFINLLNCPNQCVSVENSKSVRLHGFNVDVSAGDKDGLGQNTDGFVISESNAVMIQFSNVKTQGYCVAVNSGTDLHFRDLICSGGHGFSLSVGTSTSDSSKNKVSTVDFRDSSVSNSSNGIHIKTHTDAANGSISDIIYQNITFSGITNYGINVQQDYQGGGSTGKPGTNIPIEGLILKKVFGTMTSSNAEAVYVLCGSGACSNFTWSEVDITGAAKDNSCTNVQISGFTC